MFLLCLIVLACFASGERFDLVQFCGPLNDGELLTQTTTNLSFSLAFFLSLLGAHSAIYNEVYRTWDP